MATTFTSRGAYTMNSMFFKPMLRKSIHKKSASHDMIRETVKADAGEEVKTRGLTGAGAGDTEGLVSWVPHERTGIYYPKGHEKVLQDVPPGTATDMEVVNWFS